MEAEYTAAEFLASDLADDLDTLPRQILDAIEATTATVRDLPPGDLTAEHSLRFELAVRQIREGVDRLLTLGVELGERRDWAD